MGIISDKLMRIINTKEDIRQALISKGYDVPTSIPFKEYAKMILDLPCNADSFPDIEGIVARYSASGLTNEQMAANPVWVDKTGNGHDLQMKNFSWKGMSGVGGYVGDFSKWVNNRDTTEIGITKSNSKVIIDVKVSQGSGKSIVFISKSNLGISNNVTIKITSTYPEGVMKFANSASNKYLKLPSNGIITLQDNPEYTSNEMHLHLASADLGQITIEQLPLYPGALVFDGVDDWAGCDNLPLLPKEKGYSIIALRNWITRYDATEEELTKIKDYFIKTYPWLFPDQAWTVTGKTNEDEDRATIANITGNGNDLVLSNFGFAEGSGYGLYYQYFGNEFKATNGEIEGGGWNIIDNYNISHDKRIPINSIGKCFWGNKALVNGIKLRFKLTGMTEGDVLAFGYAATYNLTYTSDGIYAINLPPVDKPYGFSLQSSLTENLPTTPVTIELLPFEYEGYIVTDGVDDKIVSSVFGMGKDFTIVGDWKFIDNKKSGTGLVKGSSFYIYNTMIGLDLYINSGSVKNSLDGIKSINAACSDGRAYDRNWNEILANTGNVVGSGGPLEVSSSGGRFDRIAFKNLAIYPRILSKDDCIKAYNYLQTLKSK